MTTSSHPARTFFLYLLSFVTLYMTAVALGGVLWQLINKFFPDAAMNSYFYENVNRTLIEFLSTLIVTTPVYVFMTWKVSNEQEKDESFRSSQLRKWLTYITLFAAAIIVLVDLIMLVQNLLEGEITTRFILKALVVLVLAGGIFWYYIGDMKKHE